MGQGALETDQRGDGPDPGERMSRDSGGTFAGKVALVVGGGTGIGRAVAEVVAERGGRAVVAGRRLDRLKQVVAVNPERIDHVQLDVADLAAHEHAVRAVVERHGRLDILVNSAALSVWKPFEQHTAEDFTRVFHTNLVAQAMLIQAALPYLRESRGNVVNVSSVSGKYNGMPPQNLPAYSPSKAALNQLTRVLSTELGPYGIRVNAVAPGVTDTEIAAGVFANKDLIARNIAETPLGRTASARDVALAICMLASDDAGWVTGQIVDATGGYHLTQ